MNKQNNFWNCHHYLSVYIFTYNVLIIHKISNVFKSAINALWPGNACALLFTPFSATRFAMHRIYATRINSRSMSRVFCDLRSQKTPRGMLPVNSNACAPWFTNILQLFNTFRTTCLFTSKKGAWSTIMPPPVYTNDQPLIIKLINLSISSFS